MERRTRRSKRVSSSAASYVYKGQVDKCAAWSLQVATCYEALEKEAENGGGVSWRIKPKLHMMQEMHEYQSYVVGNPKNHMEYKDESFCGEIAALATRRGGANTHAENALGVMAKYKALLQMGEIKEQVGHYFNAMLLYCHACR